MSFTLWFTGLSGTGKSTLSRLAFLECKRRGLAAELLDGDLIRGNFSQELGFSKTERDINVRRIGFVSHLLNKHGVISVVAAIAPYQDARLANRALIGNYVEAFVDCPLEVVERRDPKGLYARVRAGKIANFTGVSDPYEPPVHPEIVARTDSESIEESSCRVIRYLEEAELIPAKDSCILRPGVEEDAAWRNRLADLGYVRGGFRN